MGQPEAQHIVVYPCNMDDVYDGGLQVGRPKTGAYRNRFSSSTPVTYFIGAADGTGLCKIGTTGALHRRVREHQTGSPIMLSVWRVVGGNRESEFHARFAHCRKHGEWFDIPYHIVECVF